MNAGIFFAVVLSGLPLFSVTFPATTNQNYAVVFTAGPGGGRVPQNISSRNTAVTVTDIPYGTQFTITYTGNTGYNGGSSKNGTVTADETVSHNAASLKMFSVTFPATTNENFSVTFTAGGYGGTLPSNVASRNTATTVSNIPYGTQYSIAYTGATGYNGGSTKTGTVTSTHTVSHNAASLKKYRLTVPATTNQKYTLTLATSSVYGGTLPTYTKTATAAAQTINNVPHGTAWTITYTGNTGYNGGASKNGTITAATTISHNAASLKTYTYTIKSNSSNVNVRTAAVNAGWDEVSKLAVVVNSGIYVYGSSTSGYAMTISGTFKNGVTLTNNGYIVGRGGAGGKGGNALNSSGVTADGVAGGAGGTAINLASDCTIVNNGTIAGGGGGGGGGAAHRGSVTITVASTGERKTVYSSTGGSGGGGGRVNGTAGAAGTGSDRNGNAGAAGSLTAAGDGGEGRSYDSNADSYGGKGGNGGAWGAAGGAGQKGGATHNSGTAGAGGAKGKYIAGNSHATWSKTGTRIGGYS